MSESLTGTAGVLRRRFLQQWKERGLWHAVGYMGWLFSAVLLTPLYRLTRGRKTFTFQHHQLPYFIHWYNTTFDNERAVEVSLARYVLSLHAGKKILEVGNVLSHYLPVSHTVLDKYEKGSDVIHEDVASFRPKELYDLIISFSTLEHVGFDEEPKDPQKILRALQNLRSSLAPGGRILATIPVGCNPNLTPLLRNEELFDRQHYLVRVSASNQFVETTKEEALKHEFNRPYSFGNAVVVGLIGSWPEFS
ncbi:MAG: hypothetical protein PHE68_04870 [Candidatus Peribacteraceae bacterium]|nr:hypothetical protein [Candidatus Peribacteraceae bacterium]MDD5074786.1 hypothetical protein [Candidatus Peribacteraceae bacterium]